MKVNGVDQSQLSTGFFRRGEFRMCDKMSASVTTEILLRSFTPGGLQR